MAALKRYSAVLLVAGIGLIAGSCVPLAQTLWSAQSAPPETLPLPPDRPATLELPAPVSAAPVVRIEPYPGALQEPGATLEYAFSIRDPGGQALLARSGTAGAGPGFDSAGGSAGLRIAFPALTIPAGRSTVRLDVGDAAALVRHAEMVLAPPSLGLLPALMTTLMLAILGWLAACLGALQWIRAEAARPAAVGGTPAAGDAEGRLWAVACHLSALAGYIVPFGHLLGPLAVWLWKRDRLPAVEQAGRSALNFQLSVTMYVLAGLLLSFFLVGVAVLFVVVVFQFAVVLYASLRAQRGLDVHYPLTIRFI